MKQNHSITLLTAALWIGLLAAKNLPAQPAWSRGIQILTATHTECMKRAEMALLSEGYFIQNRGGDYVGGIKNNHSAVITSNAVSGGKVYVNIFVASISNDGGVPGAERIRLQGRMDGSITSTPPVTSSCGLGRTWADTEAGLSMTWTRRGDSNVFDVSGMVGGQIFTAEQTIEINGNKVFVNRYKALDGNTCTFQGTIQNDGKTVTGTYSCSRFQPSGGWKAVINCN